MKTKIEIGTQVTGSLGSGVIEKVITKSTGYVVVNYNGTSKKEMAFNLTDVNGILLKAKPASNSVAKLKEKLYVTSPGSAFTTQSELDAFEVRRETAKLSSLSSLSRF